MHKSSTVAGRALGLDIGGANLKIGNALGESCASYFPLWSQSHQLGEHIRKLLTHFVTTTGQTYDRLVLTMTGEMADCFATRRQGVRTILEHVAQTTARWPIAVYAVDGAWLTPTEAMADPWRVAASNWHALATWLVRGPAASLANPRLVIDVGSTTVDVIPVDSEGVCTPARSDGDRLKLQQLVYTGLARTPVAAILSEARLGDAVYPLVAEQFATSDDAYLLLGLVDEGEGPTADQRPRTAFHARARLARMLGEDSERLQAGEVESLAEQVIAAQAEKVAQAIRKNLSVTASGNFSDDQPLGQNSLLIVSGHGRPLAAAALKRLDFPFRTAFVEELLSPAAARGGPAVAVAWLAEQASSQVMSSSPRQHQQT